MFPRRFFAGVYFAPTYYPPVTGEDEEQPQPVRRPVGSWLPREKQRPLDDDEFLMLFWD